MSETLTFEKKDRIAYLTLNQTRAEKCNYHRNVEHAGEVLGSSQ